MLYLISYDVSTSTPSGRKRLRHVARECENYGVRVQNSVFECELSYEVFQMLKHRLSQIIEPSVDSLRFYPLGKLGHDKVIHIGAKKSLDVTAPLIL
ncbi:MAG: CRISPR-associated endonuclease Cas2 [Akkermansiaceae bacterium]|nr:CRISPR-associated endonuclease Cas2 [Akkermansiaceae bacterium]